VIVIGNAHATVGPGERPSAAVPRDLPDDLRHVMLLAKFGVDEVMTKVSILRDELYFDQEHNPIEHISSRLKSPSSILAKAERKGIPLTADAIREQMCDLAGVRVTCGFVSDIYRVRQMIVRQRDLEILEERDYIATPKPNGYKSLHLIVRVPVFLSDHSEDVVVEIQLRTIAMDFWASLEHKIYYKYDKDVPRHLVDSLKLAADVAWSLDTSMERIHDEVHALDDPARSDAAGRFAASAGLGDVAAVMAAHTETGPTAG
jgi:putative GTP pyrophosphokinase